MKRMSGTLNMILGRRNASLNLRPEVRALLSHDGWWDTHPLDGEKFPAKEGERIKYFRTGLYQLRVQLNCK